MSDWIKLAPGATKAELQVLLFTLFTGDGHYTNLDYRHNDKQRKDLARAIILSDPYYGLLLQNILIWSCKASLHYHTTLSTKIQTDLNNALLTVVTASNNRWIEQIHEQINQCESYCASND